MKGVAYSFSGVWSVFERFQRRQENAGSAAETAILWQKRARVATAYESPALTD